MYKIPPSPLRRISLGPFLQFDEIINLLQYAAWIIDAPGSSYFDEEIKISQCLMYLKTFFLNPKEIFFSLILEN